MTIGRTNSRRTEIPQTSFPEKIRRRSIWAMDVPIISRAAGTVMFPSRVIGVVDVPEQGYRRGYYIRQALDVEYYYQRGQVTGYHCGAHEDFPVQFQPSGASLYHLFPERKGQEGEWDIQQACIEDSVFAENRGYYRVADEADVAEGQHESVDALHVLVKPTLPKVSMNP